MKKILIISGGISKERAISLDTGKQVAKELKKNNYFVKIAEPNFQLFDVIKKFKPNKIFNALHGQFGEDGYIQTILESFKIPYTHSGVISSSIAMDKVLSKKIFIKNKILTPKFLTFSFSKDEKNIVSTIEKKHIALTDIGTALDIETQLYSTQGSLGGHNLASKLVLDTNIKFHQESKEEKLLGNRYAPKIKDKVFAKLVFSKFKDGLGIMDTEYFVTAAAPMNKDVHRWFHAIGIDVTEIYGMTEDTGPATIGVPGNAAESFSKKLKVDGIETVSYTHLTLPTKA